MEEKKSWIEIEEFQLCLGSSRWANNELRWAERIGKSLGMTDYCESVVREKRAQVRAEEEAWRKEKEGCMVKNESVEGKAPERAQESLILTCSIRV